jgi:diguanylate cyclase (GGDEF)-like protein/putative nucleotidyltransferase with HDIG domain
MVRDVHAEWGFMPFGGSDDSGGSLTAGGGARPEPRLMAQVLAGLFAAGASLALLTVLLPHSSRANEAGLLIIVGDAYVVAGILAWRAGNVSGRVLQVALGWGSTLITGVAYFSGESPSPLVFFYLWVFLYSAYFFTKRQATAQIVYVAAVYGGLLAAAPPPGGVPAWWVVGIGALLVAAVVIGVMRQRNDQLIGRLYDAARTDPLTQLLNRRGFRDLLDLDLERARRSGGRTAVVVGDVDHFKQVNDRSGHSVGDAALKRVARLLEQGKRQIDVAARVGGEEFALIIPDADEDGALALAERLRLAVREEFLGAAVPITISFGIASYPAHGETAASLLRAGDEALYAAKESGRNRAVTYTPMLRGRLGGGPERQDIGAERFVSVLLDLAEAVDLRFSGTARHSETVGRYAEMMARELGLPEERVIRLRLGGMLHDIGKIGVPDAILQKPGGLTDAEFAIIKQHPALGAQILEHPSLTDIQTWVATHHERPDGRGYPLGISGDELTLEARILAVADAYEAMTSDRAYRPSIGHTAARAELARGARTQFDARVVVAFTAALQPDADQAPGVLTAA